MDDYNSEFQKSFPNEQKKNNNSTINKTISTGIFIRVINLNWNDTFRKNILFFALDFAVAAVFTQLLFVFFFFFIFVHFFLVAHTSICIHSQIETDVNAHKHNYTQISYYILGPSWTLLLLLFVCARVCVFFSFLAFLPLNLLFSFDNNNVTAHVPSNYMNSTPLFVYTFWCCCCWWRIWFFRVTNARSTRGTLSIRRFANTLKLWYSLSLLFFFIYFGQKRFHSIKLWLVTQYISKNVRRFFTVFFFVETSKLFFIQYWMGLC